MRPAVPPDQVRAVTPRAVATALVIVVTGVLWSEWSPYYFDGSQISRSHFPVAFFLPFLIVGVFNALVKRRWPGRGLTRPELVVVLGMGLVAMSVPYDGVMKFLIGTLAVPFYFASPENGWALYLHEHVPAWLAPPNARNAMVWFFEGTPAGEVPPLGVWAAPLFWWTCLLGAMAFAVFCLVVMIRKQWMEHERLTYPLLEVGGALTETEAGGRLARFLRSPLFYLGFGLVMGIKMWNVASYFSLSIPEIPIEGQAFRVFPGFPIIMRLVNFYAIGFGYFARLDVLFSVWFFVLATAFEVFAFNRIGYPLGAGNSQWQSAALGWQSLGALLFLAAWSLYMARRHLRVVWRKALRPECEVDDSQELLSYRTAVFGWVGALAFATAWLCAAGMEVWVALTFLSAALLTFLGLSKVVAELGLAFVYYQVQPYEAVLHLWGSRLMAPSSVTALSFMRVFNSIGKGFLMPAFTQAVKAVYGTVRPRRIAAVIWLALGAGFAVSLCNTLFVGYRYGAYNMEKGGVMVGTQSVFNQAASAIRSPLPMGGDGRVMWAGIGLAAMAALTLVRYRATWWPLHPIGLAIQGSYGVTRPAISIFLVWTIKWTVMQIGGVRLYERGKPFFVGLLAGQGLSTAIVFVVDLIWFPLKGHNVHNF
ncbi:MAG: hypothetical protein A3F84_26140 [Candidatus Handelsmanbacteria bacterium RIFCSPLOWO2_12_FULL_64_10]|uniref:Uncharacterized protein n=1 Tax=Handelsmanbacteria sp. (strain RIFCSPLOWO2_12_FULL_64_10) TaxID=1817868 RepID=A0A1F6CB19_HANXR|nr:MAG: hypothetical protein A3F84_26140 [Candidatus Handelsmanbacteria bacterium RIFCSPLOWO2_12_FULL_64_10]